MTPKPNVSEPITAGTRVWTVESVRALGLTTTVETAASILGISRTKAYALAKSGDFRSSSCGRAAGTSCRPPRCWSS